MQKKVSKHIIKLSTQKMIEYSTIVFFHSKASTATWKSVSFCSNTPSGKGGPQDYLGDGMGQDGTGFQHWSYALFV